MILAIFAVMLRFYARRISKAHLGWDDWFAFASLIFGIATDILDLYGLRNGEARHRFMADLSSVVISQNPLLATLWMLTASVLSLKLSILALYRRISPTLTRFRNVLIVSGIVIAVLQLVTALVYTVSCFPLVFLWEMTIPGGSCWNGQYVNVAWCVADLLTGIWVLVLSIPVLKDLDAGGKRKIAVAALLVIGGFVCVAAAVRISLLVLLDGNDASRSAVPYTIWTTLEVNIGYVVYSPILQNTNADLFHRIISVCLPCLRPLHRVSKCLSKRSASRSKPNPRSLETRKKTYGRHGDNKSTNGVWTTSATSGGADQERILGKDVETWPMSSIGVTKEVDISRDRSFV